jgi:hypothetical protein
MDNQPKIKKSWKQKLFYEFTEYLVNFIYMAIIFSSVILYRRLVLAQHGIIAEDYFIGVVKAFVIAKVVMIGTFLKISHKFEREPLLIPIVYKAFLFTIMVMLFDVFEEFIKSLIHNHNLLQSIDELQSHVSVVWLGASLLIFFIFIPFFAAKELIRVLGKDNVKAILLERRKK